MESKTNAPSFTVSLRGYDRLEVDEYLDSLAEALGQVEQAEDRVHGMQAHIDRLNARIAELEDRIQSEVPRSGALLGERIAIMLQSAEEAAADTISRAQTQAAELMRQAEQEVAAAEDQARGATQRGEEQARRVEAAARAEAAEIIAEAESRASTRTRQIEQWADQVISHTRSEEARMLSEQQDKRERAEAELRALADQREAVAAGIAVLRDQLVQALEGVRQAPPISLPATSLPPVEAAVTEVEEAEDGRDEPEASTTDRDEPVTASAVEVGAVRDEAGIAEVVEGDDEEMPWPSAFRPDDDAHHEMAIDRDEDDTEVGGADEPVDDTQERDEFDDKFDAWVTGSLGPRHFRRL